MRADAAQEVRDEFDRDAGGTTMWAETADGAEQTGPGNGGGRNFSVYGRDPPQITPPPGAYSGTPTVTVAYSFSGRARCTDLNGAVHSISAHYSGPVFSWSCAPPVYTDQDDGQSYCRQTARQYDCLKIRTGRRCWRPLEDSNPEPAD
ncbi:MAG: spore coat protein U domain-containing protein [Paracoccaceae bacterium]